MPSGPALIEPVWHAQLGEPYVGEVHVTLPGAASCAIPTAYFRTLVRQASSELVESGRLAADDAVLYLACAYCRRARAEAPSSAAARFAVEEDVAPLPIDERPLDSLTARATFHGPIHDDMPAFIPQHVLDEIAALTQEAGAAETGGVLIGHLHWDARQWCRNCPEESRAKCKLSGEFFSAHDARLHRTVFARAYSLALVVSDSYATGLTWPLFGWQQGLIRQRGFGILDARGPAARTTEIAAPVLGGNDDAPNPEPALDPRWSERLTAVGKGALSVEEKLRFLQVLRATGPDMGQRVDHFLLEESGRLHQGLLEARANQAKVQEVLERLTAPPWFPGVFLRWVPDQEQPRALVAQGNGLCVLRFRDGKARTVAGRELASGRVFEQVCRAARRRAFLREVHGGDACVQVADLEEAVAQALERLATTLSLRNVRVYLDDLPQDLDVVSVEPLRRRVPRPHRYRKGVMD